MMEDKFFPFTTDRTMSRYTFNVRTRLTLFITEHVTSTFLFYVLYRVEFEGGVTSVRFVRIGSNTFSLMWVLLYSGTAMKRRDFMCHTRLISTRVNMKGAPPTTVTFTKNAYRTRWISGARRTTITRFNDVSRLNMLQIGSVHLRQDGRGGVICAINANCFLGFNFHFQVAIVGRIVGFYRHFV